MNKRFLFLVFVFIAMFFALTTITSAKADNDCTGHSCDPLPTQAEACNGPAAEHNPHCNPNSTPEPTDVVTSTPEPTDTVVPTATTPVVTETPKPTDDDDNSNVVVTIALGGGDPDQGSKWLDVTDGCETSVLIVFAGRGKDKIELGKYEYDWANGLEWNEAESGHWYDTRDTLYMFTWVEFDPQGTCAEADRLADANYQLENQVDTLGYQVNGLSAQLTDLNQQVVDQKATLMEANACTSNPFEWGVGKMEGDLKSSITDAANADPLGFALALVLVPFVLLLILAVFWFAGKSLAASVAKPVTTKASEADKNNDSNNEAPAA